VWFNRNSPEVDYKFTELTQIPSESPSAGGLSRRILNAAAGNSLFHLSVRLESASLERLSQWPRVAQRVRTGLYTGSSSTSQRMRCTLVLRCSLREGETVCTVFHRCFWHTSTAVLGLRPPMNLHWLTALCGPKSESQHADLAWTDVECYTPYFLNCRTSLRWPTALTLIMQLTDALSCTSSGIMGLYNTILETGTLWTGIYWTTLMIMIWLFSFLVDGWFIRQFVLRNAESALKIHKWNTVGEIWLSILEIVGMGSLIRK
jgi:hypothetical protein